MCRAVKTPELVCVGKFSPHFPCCWKENLFFRAPSLCVAAGECLQSFEIHYGGVYVTMPTAHIFAIFHHNFFFYVFGDGFFLCAANNVCRRRLWEWETRKNCIQQFKNWKIVLKECQKHFREMLEKSFEGVSRAHEQGKRWIPLKKTLRANKKTNSVFILFSFKSKRLGFIFK